MTDFELSDPFYPLEMWDPPMKKEGKNEKESTELPAVTGSGVAVKTGKDEKKELDFAGWFHHPLMGLHAGYLALLQLQHRLFSNPAPKEKSRFPSHGGLEDHRRFMQSILTGHNLLSNHSLFLDVHKRHDQYVIVVDVSGVDVQDIDLRVNTKTRTMEITAVRHHTATTSPATTTAGSGGAQAETNEKQCTCFIDLNTCHCNGHCGRAPTKTANPSNSHCSDCAKKGENLNSTDSKTKLNRACCGVCIGRATHTGTSTAGVVTGCGSSVIRTERSYGSLFRRLKLPIDADLTQSISSTVHNGQLTIKIKRYLLPHTTESGARENPHDLIVQVRALTDTAIHEVAAISADPNRRQNVLSHHITVPDHVNRSVEHAKIEAQIKGIATAAANGRDILNPATAETAACAAATTAIGTAAAGASSATAVAGPTSGGAAAKK